MKIIIKDYQTGWLNDFLEQRAVIGSTLIDFNPIVEHIGSTSVVGLCAKPTIDILVGLQAEKQLDMTISPMISQGYTYFRKYEPAMPYRRLFSNLKPLTNKAPPKVIDLDDEFVRGQAFAPLTNTHIVVKDTSHWHRHLAFRDFLRAHDALRDEYGLLKKAVSRREFKDTNDYNDAKAEYIKKIERQALAWYSNQNKDGK
ncbi:MAG: GrpB family protein [Chloroflexota bacterium]